MDVSSLATVDPNVVASRLQKRASSGTKVDSSTSTADATSSSSIGAMGPPSPPLSYFSHHNAPAREPAVTLEDWEDLKEMWNRCMEVVNVEDPADVLPLLRGIIHECSRFLQELEDPSVIYMSPPKPDPVEECVSRSIISRLP